MARAAARAAAVTEEALQGVFFLNPLAIEAAGLLVECVVCDGRFEVRSGEDEDALNDAARTALVRTTAERWQRVELAPVRADSCVRAASIGDLYAGFKSSGLQYGTSFRTLIKQRREQRTARLQARTSERGTACASSRSR